MVLRQNILLALIGLSAVGLAFSRSAGAAGPATSPSPSSLHANAAGERVITFDDVALGKAVATYTQGEVTFTLAAAPQHSRAQGRITCFPHLKTERRGILNAMANEQSIPVKAQIAGGASSVTLVLWGTIGCHAWVEAYNQEGKLLQRAALSDVVPQRKSPSEPIPSFELTVKSSNIAYIHFGGAINGGALVADEMRYLPASAANHPSRTGTP